MQLSLPSFFLPMGYLGSAGYPVFDFDLRDLSRQRESLVDEMTSLKIEIKQLLNITFPELSMWQDITKSILKLLQQYPSAFALRDADLVNCLRR